MHFSSILLQVSAITAAAYALPKHIEDQAGLESRDLPSPEWQITHLYDACPKPPYPPPPYRFHISAPASAHVRGFSTHCESVFGYDHLIACTHPTVASRYAYFEGSTVTHLNIRHQYVTEKGCKFTTKGEMEFDQESPCAVNASFTIKPQNTTLVGHCAI